MTHKLSPLLRTLYQNLNALNAEDSDVFHDLAEAAGLDRTRDFRDRDLRSLNFTDADLRGFDISGSDLRGTLVRACHTIDGTTTLANAQLDREDIDWLARRFGGLPDSSRIRVRPKSSAGSKRVDGRPRMGIAQPMQPIATPNFPNQRTGPFGVLDIGSSKIVCMIGRLDHDGHIDVMGQGCSKSLGVRGGNICDLDGAKRTIRAAIATAEKRAKFRLSSVTVNLSCGQPESRILSVEYPLHGRQINDAELHQLGAEARARAISPGRETIHCLPISIEVPETILVTGGPVGLCDVASARFHVIDAMSTALRNLGGTVGRCGLEITDVVSAAFAAGISSLTDDERKLGATLIDMGGGTTDIAVFAGGHLLYTAQIPVGGQHVTRDIAGVFGTSIEHAERLKILYGTIVECEDDDSEMIALQLIGEVENQFTHVPRSALTKIIRLRVQEIFELVRGRVDNDALGRAASQVTLTGGASQIPGMRDMATKVLGRPAQLGRIPELNGLDENSYDPSLATAAGLLAWSANELQAYGEHNFAMSSRQRIGRIVRSLVDQV